MELKFANPSLCLRPIVAADEEGLFRIYSSTRTTELAQVTNWTAYQKEAFLRMQFKVQHDHYQANYREAHFWVLIYQQEFIGRLYVHPLYERKSLRIIDIALLPAWRNKGLGTQVLQAVMDYAANHNRSVTIHVESFNPAMKLYSRLGFAFVSQTNGVYHLLEWKPAPQTPGVNGFANQFIKNGSGAAFVNGR